MKQTALNTSESVLVNKSIKDSMSILPTPLFTYVLKLFDTFGLVIRKTFYIDIMYFIIQEGLLSVTSQSMCMKYWLTACSSLPRKKCG